MVSNTIAGINKPEQIEPDSRLEYAMLVTERRGGFELHVRELLLTVRASTLQAAYYELLERKRELIEGARIIGKLHTLPVPQALPSIVPKDLSAPD